MFWSNKQKKIELITPQPYDEVGKEFLVEGWVPKSWFAFNHGFHDYICLNVYKLDGNILGGSYIEISRKWNWKDAFSNKIYFSKKINYSIFDDSGCVVMELHKFDNGYSDEYNLYIPLFSVGFKLKNLWKLKYCFEYEMIGEKILKYKQERQKYDKELDRILKKRKKICDLPINQGIDVENEDILYGVFHILQGQKDEIIELKEQYMEVLKWRGPELGAKGGRVGELEGFEFTVFSNDHGNHFHIMHKERGINARFSFPEIELLNYKISKNYIKTKEIKRIKEFFGEEKNLRKLQAEFAKKMC